MTEELDRQVKTRDEHGRLLPGNTANPNGRPPNKKYLSEWARELLKEVPIGELKGRRADELVTLALIREALKGNTKAIEILHDWTEGKTPDIHKLDIPVNIIYKLEEGKE